MFSINRSAPPMMLYSRARNITTDPCSGLQSRQPFRIHDTHVPYALCSHPCNDVLKYIQQKLDSTRTCVEFTISWTHIPRHLVMVPSLGTVSHTAFTHGLVGGHMWYRGASKTHIPPGKHAVHANYTCDAVHNSLLPLLPPWNGTNHTSHAVGALTSTTSFSFV